MSSSPVALRDLAPGKFHTLSKVKPVGSLQARRQTSGSLAFYWRYSQGTQSERVLIGVHDPLATPKQLKPTQAGYSLAAAVRAAEELALEHHNHRDQGGRPALVAAKAKAETLKAEAESRAATATLKHLLINYCEYLKALERDAHRNARSAFQLHVIDAFPEIADKPAADVTEEEIANLVRRVNKAGKGRTANKVRSYIHAAYEVAIASRTSITIPEDFKTFGVRENPVSRTKPDPKANKADKAPLSLDHLRTYWRLIKDLPGFEGALLRLHLLTGGQRIEQLARLLTSNIKDKHIVLFDGKGRPDRDPRAHWVPLIKDAQQALRECKPSGLYALSTRAGKVPIAGTTLSGWAQDVARDKIPDFKAKRIRSGVETALASVGVSLEARGHLQSHGITGIQARHYDGHDYLDTKREALETLYKLLTNRTQTKRRPSKAS